MTASPESPELKTLKNVADRLEQASIPYMLTGSMALNFYGHPRATNDFDIVIEIQKGAEKKLYDLFRDDFYISEEALHKAAAGEGMFNIIDMESVFKIDLIIRKGDPYSQVQFRRRLAREFQGWKIFVVTPEDLVLAKLLWSQENLSEMQERDVHNLFRILSREMDYAYMEKWASNLGLLKRLRSFYVPS